MSKLRQAKNDVYIEGTLAEVNINQAKAKDSGEEYVGGDFKIRVDQKDVGIIEIPVNVYAKKLKKDGNPNPSYDSISKLLEMTSLGSGAGIEQADRVRIKGEIIKNEYWRSPTELTEYPRVRTSFVNVAKKGEKPDQADFSVEFVVQNTYPEIGADGVETGRLKIKAVIPGFNDRVSVVEFIAANESVKNAISQYWNKGDSVKANGRLNFNATTVEKEIKSGFGEGIIKPITTNVSELLITGGSEFPMEGAEAWTDKDALNAALAERDAYLESRKDADLKRGRTVEAPAQGLGSDLGF